jgi:hypothetical protein
MLIVRIITIVVLLPVLFSCEGVFKLPEQSTGAKTIDELYVSPKFNWSTSQDVTVLINGLIKRQGYTSPKAPLTISGNNKKYYNGMHSMHENYEISISVPADIKTLNITYGLVENTVEIKNNQAILTLTPVITEE